MAKIGMEKSVNAYDTIQHRIRCLVSSDMCLQSNSPASNTYCNLLHQAIL